MLCSCNLAWRISAFCLCAWGLLFTSVLLVYLFLKYFKLIGVWSWAENSPTQPSLQLFSDYTHVAAWHLKGWIHLMYFSTLQMFCECFKDFRVLRSSRDLLPEANHCCWPTRWFFLALWLLFTKLSFMSECRQAAVRRSELGTAVCRPHSTAGPGWGGPWRSALSSWSAARDVEHPQPISQRWGRSLN